MTEIEFWRSSMRWTATSTSSARSRRGTWRSTPRIEKKRSCERLLQLAVEATIDACAMLVSGLRLGLPGEENDLFEKLARRDVISKGMTETLRRMKGMRNLLVHEYGRVDDELIFDDKLTDKWERSIGKIGIDFRLLSGEAGNA